jgi:hypothetical protein
MKGLKAPTMKGTMIGAKGCDLRITSDEARYVWEGGGTPSAISLAEPAGFDLERDIYKLLFLQPNGGGIKRSKP